MDTKNQVHKLAITAAVTVIASAGIAQGSARPQWAEEKCFGASLAAKNDCASNHPTKEERHACSGKAKKDRDPSEWVYTPSGLCEKLGGKTVALKK
jgi:uncharacterized membrane protein